MSNYWWDVKNKQKGLIWGKRPFKLAPEVASLSLSYNSLRQGCLMHL